MLVHLKSKKEVTIDTFNGIKAIPEFELISFVEETEGYRCVGDYFYSKEIEKTDPVEYEKILIRQFGTFLSVMEADQLFVSLKIVYPDPCTFTQRARIDKLAGAKYLIGVDQNWGLTSDDWEVIS